MKNFGISDILENLGFVLIILGIVFIAINAKDFISYLLFGVGVILTYVSRIIRKNRQ